MYMELAEIFENYRFLVVYLHLNKDNNNNAQYIATKKIIDSINAAVAALDEREQEIISLYLQGFNTAIIGEKVGYSERYIRQIRKEALEKITKIVQPVYQYL